MARPDHASRCRPRLERRSGGFRQLKTRRHVIQHDDFVAESFRGDFQPARLIGQRKDGVGVSMVNKAGWEEGVNQGFYGRRCRRCPHQMSAKLVDHGGVGKRGKRTEPPQVFEVKSCVTRGLDGGKVKSRSFDINHRTLLAEKIGDLTLEGSVPSAVEDQGGFGAEQARGVGPQR